MMKLLGCVIVLCAVLSPTSSRVANAQDGRGGAGVAAQNERGERGGGDAAGRGRNRGRGGARGGSPPGPPAPVPAEVAMLRPSSDEVEQLNIALQRLVEMSDSSARTTLKKYESLLKVQVPRDNPCIRPTGRDSGQHQQFVEIANNGGFDILFLGDSITYLWTVGEGDVSGYLGGKRLFDQHFAGLKIANFGIPGDTTQGVLWRLQNGEGQGHKPKAVMLMLGTNNTGGNSPEEIAEGVGAVVLELRKNFPDAKILLMAIFPRGASPGDANRQKVESVNRIIAKLGDQKQVYFMNINSKFISESGGLIGFRPTENLHPIEEGFDIWGAAVAATLKSWVQ
jgi:lysophospholipase L1-like esterase